MHIVNRPKKPKFDDSDAAIRKFLGLAPAALNIKPAYSLWFAAGLVRHLKGQPYVKIQRSIVQA